MDQSEEETNDNAGSAPIESGSKIERKQVRRPPLVIGYFMLWGTMAFSAMFLNIINVDWHHNPLWLGIAIVILASVLEGSVLELSAMATATAILGGHRRQTKNAPFDHLTLVMNYNLLAVNDDDVSDTFQTMYEAYMGNLNDNISCVLVSATNDPRLKQLELESRNRYRKLIYSTLFEEGVAFAGEKYHLIDRFHLRYVWFKYIHLNKDTFVNEHLDKICRKFSSEFMVVHRVSRVLKKCGQYQDLMILSEGDNSAFSYTDQSYYGKYARKYAEPLFHVSEDTDNVFGRRYDYTLVLDSDTAVSTGTCYELLAIAAAYPDRGIIQPAIKMDVTKDDTIFMHIENVRQLVNDPITNALTELLGQSGFYGKGLLRNRIYIDNIIGTREHPIERVPIDVLSHDTFEAACLRPLYASNIFLLEAPCLNYVTWDMRETRWNKGEIILAMYFWPHTVGKVLRYFQSKTYGADFVPTYMRTKSNFDVVSSYLAHSALRNLLMKPLILVYIVCHLFVHLHYPRLPIFLIMFFVLVYPKFAVYNGHNFQLILIEVLASLLQFTPEAFVGTFRVIQAIRSYFDKNAKWVPQRAVEDEFKTQNPFTSSIKHLWLWTVTASVLTAGIIFLDKFTVNRNYLMFSMIGTLFLLPFYTAVTTMPVSTLKYFNKKSVTLAVKNFAQLWKKNLSSSTYKTKFTASKYLTWFTKKPAHYWDAFV